MLKKFCFTFLFLFLITFTAQAAQIFSIIPNHAAPGETLSIRIAGEDFPDRITPSMINGGPSLEVLSVEGQYKQQRRERMVHFVRCRIKLAGNAIGPITLFLTANGQVASAKFYAIDAPRFSPYGQIALQQNPVKLIAAHLNEDSRTDVIGVLTSFRSDGNILVARSQERFRTVDLFQPVAGDDHPLGSASDAVAAHLNDDEAVDIGIAANEQFDVPNPFLVKAINDGAGNFTQGSQNFSVQGRVLASGDLNGDGRDELLIGGIRGAVTVLFAGGRRLTIDFSTLPADVRQIAVGDVNRDGRPDVVAALNVLLSSQGPAVTEVGVALSSAPGGQQFRIVRGYRSPQLTGDYALVQNLMLIDIDGDGSEEIAATLNDGSAIRVLRFDAGRFQALQDVRVFCSSMTAADINGDGEEDLLCASEDVDHVAIIQAASGDRLGFPLTYSAPAFPISIAAGDWNGDSLIDYVVGTGKRYFPLVPEPRKKLSYFIMQP